METLAEMRYVTESMATAADAYETPSDEGISADDHITITDEEGSFIVTHPVTGNRYAVTVTPIR